MNTQEKFLAAMGRLAEKHDVDLVVDHAYSNTGRIAFQPHEAFKPLLTFSFDFQAGYASFGGLERGWSYVTAEQDENDRHRTLDQFVSRVAELLAQEEEQ